MPPPIRKPVLNRLGPAKTFGTLLHPSGGTASASSPTQNHMEVSDSVAGNEKGATGHVSDLFRAFDSQTKCLPVKVAARGSRYVTK
jgi:hypothetical protein